MTSAAPLQGACEHSCLKLNLLYDGGFRGICDETTATNEWPLCEGDPAEDDLFHMRQCILTCRSPLSSVCPNIHERGNDHRGCQAGQAFLQGLPYEFFTGVNESVIFQSLVTAAPTAAPKAAPTSSPTDTPTIQLTIQLTPSPTGSPTGTPSMLLTALTGSPTMLLTKSTVSPTGVITTTLGDVLLPMTLSLVVIFALVALLLRRGSSVGNNV